MHRLWCKVAVQTLRQITDTEGLIEFKQAEQRAVITKSCCKKVQCLSNMEGTPAIVRQRRMNKLAGRLKELHNQLQTDAKYKAEGKQVSE